MDTKLTATSPLLLDAPVSALMIAVASAVPVVSPAVEGGPSVRVQAASVNISTKATPLQNVPRPKHLVVNRPVYLGNLLTIAMTIAMLYLYTYSIKIN